jgi:hypothetical protein
MSKHTQGEWYAEDMGNIGPADGHEIWICFDECSSIASVRHGADDEEYGGEEALKANALLMAQSKKLLEALENLLEALKHVDTSNNNDRLLRDLGIAETNAMAAIQKATGEV